MRDAARSVGQFITGVTESDFQESLLLQHAVVHCLYIIGEATSRVTESTRFMYPDVE
jgi:uncharacterized protein with HEPN domain